MRALDLTNQTFGTLTAKTASIMYKKRGWECTCSCGNTKWVPTFQLTNGIVKTCGADIHKQSIKIGERFGKLVVKSVYRDNKNRRYMAECACDCGSIKANASFKNLQRGSTTHCGCSPDNSNRGLSEGIACRNALIASYKHNAKKRKLPFLLTEKECIKLFEGDCYFCGQPPSEILTRKNAKGSYKYSGIDRINSDEGYILGNVASCCTACNYLKVNRTNASFIGHIKRIYTHLFM